MFSQLSERETVPKQVSTDHIAMNALRPVRALQLGADEGRHHNTWIGGPRYWSSGDLPNSFGGANRVLPS